MFTMKSFTLVVLIMAMTSSVSAQIDPCVMNCMSQYQSCAMSCGGDFTCQGKCAQDQILCNQKCQMIKIQTLITDDKPAVIAAKPVDPQCLQNCANAYITCSSSCGTDFTCIQNCNTQAMSCDKSCGTFKTTPIHNMAKAKVDPQCLQNCANSYITCSTGCGTDFTCIQTCNTQAMACDKSCGTFKAAPIQNMVQVNPQAKVNPQCLQNCANAYISCSTGCGTDFTCIQNCNTQAMNCDKLCGTFQLQVQSQRNITGEIDDECSTCCGGCDMDFTKRGSTCDDDKTCISLNKAFRGVCYDECHQHNAKCTC